KLGELTLRYGRALGRFGNHERLPGGGQSACTSAAARLCLVGDGRTAIRLSASDRTINTRQLARRLRRYAPRKGFDEPHIAARSLLVVKGAG
ncbi:MAG: hypothetical protein M3Q08_06565, partial [Pseudomonadota bacterium]|nr:hypothetical protein [Pseudomonadota bacterium]